MTERLTDFRQLNVWQKAHKLVLDIYEITKKFPKEEKTELVSHMRQASMKIPIKIAEGFMRRAIALAIVATALAGVKNFASEGEVLDLWTWIKVAGQALIDLGVASTLAAAVHHVYATCQEGKAACGRTEETSREDE